MSHLVVFQVKNLDSRKWVEQELGKHLKTVRGQLQNLKVQRANQRSPRGPRAPPGPGRRAGCWLLATDLQAAEAAEGVMA